SYSIRMLAWKLAGLIATVWAIDDGEKIQKEAAAAAAPGLATGAGNPVWSPGSPIRLFAMKNETVAFQVVVAADATPLSDVTVDLDALATETPPGTRIVGRPIERFVEHFFVVPRASGGKTPGESLG